MKVCGGTGGVLDSLLDIVGQCAPSKSGRLKPSALSAGCGKADAANIRSNCCALISLLVAVLATKTASNRSPARESETDKISDDHDETPQSKYPDGAGASESFSDWGIGDFITMKLEPGPGMATTTPNQGRAARQALSRSLGAVASPIQERVTLPVAAISTTHRARHRKQVGGTIVKDRTRTRRRAAAAKRLVPKRELGNENFAQSPTGFASPPFGRMRDREGPSQRISLIVGTAAPAVAEGTHHGKRARGGRDSANVKRPSELTHPGTGERVSLRGKSAEALPQPDMAPIVPGTLASPPRLSRLKGGGHPVFHSSSTTVIGGHRVSPSAARRTVVGDEVPLGLSTPGAGERQRPPKVSGHTRYVDGVWRSFAYQPVLQTFCFYDSLVHVPPQRIFILQR